MMINFLEGRIIFSYNFSSLHIHII